MPLSNLPLQISGPVGVISTHLDDAVLSCSGVIAAGSLVVTVFASGPARVARLPVWDAAAGFQPGDDVSAVRLREDDAALAELGARGQRLMLWPAQYRARAPRWPRIAAVTRRLRPRQDLDPRGIGDGVLAELTSLTGSSGLDTWIAPLGIAHPDHAILGAILPALTKGTPSISWHVYDDLPYAVESPELRDAGHRRLEQFGFRLEPVLVRADPERKRAAVSCYCSQAIALGDRLETALIEPERVYRLTNAVT